MHHQEMGGLVDLQASYHGPMEASCTSFSLNYFYVRKGYSWEGNPAGGEDGLATVFSFPPLQKKVIFSCRPEFSMSSSILSLAGLVSLQHCLVQPPVTLSSAIVAAFLFSLLFNNIFDVLHLFLEQV